MKHILSLLLVFILSIQLATATITYASWQPDASQQKTIDYGQAATFDWSAYGSYVPLYYNVDLYDENDVLVHSIVPYTTTYTGSVGDARTVDNTMYDYVGEHYVLVEATDAYGFYNSHRINLTIINNDLDFTSIDISATPTSGTAPLTVLFECTAYGGNAPITYEWDFGDGTTSSSKTTTYTYALVDIYTATCTATDADQDTISQSITIDVTQANRAPSIGPTSDQTIPENIYWELSLTTNDLDNDDLTCYEVATSFPSWLSLDAETCVLSGTPDEVDQNTTYTIQVGVEDSTGLTDEDSFLLTVYDTTVANIPPTPNFNWTPKYPLTGVSVVFDASSSYDSDGIIALYEFDFNGDGIFDLVFTNPSITQSYTYNSAGTYNAKLRVTDNDGAVQSIIKAVTASNKDFSSITVTATPDSGDVPLTVDFTCDVVGGDAPFSYSWDFGDNATAAIQNPTHTYTQVGDFVTTCTVTDANGDIIEGSTTVSAHPANSAPSIGPITDQIVAEDTYWELTLLVSDPDDDILTCYDASQGKNAKAGVTISSLPDWLTLNESSCTLSGTTPLVDVNVSYTVEVGVSDPDGLTDETSFTVTVYDTTIPNIAPTASFYFTPSFPLSREEVIFTSNSFDVDGTIDFYWWDVDGDLIWDYSGSALDEISHVYISAENYSVTLQVRDDDGATGALTRNIRIKNKDFNSIDITANPTSGDAPLLVDFTCKTVGGDDPVSYSWDFGDGNSASLANTSHTYNYVGDYSATCTATDANGDQISASTTIWVNQANRPPVMDPIADQFVFEDTYFELSLSVSDPDGDVLTCYDATLWNKDDGNNFQYLPDWLNLDESTCILSGTSPLVANDLSYFVMVGVRDPANLSDEENFTLTVLNQEHPPQADFTWSPTNPRVQKEVTFTSTSTDNDGSITYYWWDLNGDSIWDIQGAQTNTTTYTYNSAGTYEAKLKVQDNDGLTDTKTHYVTVTDSSFLNIDVTANPRSGDSPLKVNFSCSATGGDNPVSYSWDFGDGGSSGQQNPAHTYTQVGDFVATCTATDNDGDRIDGSVSIWVNQANRPPVMDPIADQFVFEDTYFELSLSVSDPDGDVLTCYDATLWNKNKETLDYLPDWLSLDEESCILSGTSPLVANDLSYFVMVGVRDPANLSDEENFTLTVLDKVHVNLEPIANFTWQPTKPQVDEEVIFSSSSYDPDGSITSYQWDFDNDGVFEKNGLEVTHNYVEPGNFGVTHRVIDNVGATTQITKYVWVEEKPNNAPQIGSIEDQIINENTQFNLLATATDPEGDDLTFSFDQAPSWLSVNSSTGRMSGVSPEVIADTLYSVVLRVTDEDGLHDTEEFTILVKDTTIYNSAPVITLIADSQVNESTYYSVRLNVSDPDNDVLTCIAEGFPLPNWLTLNPVTCVLSGTTPQVDNDTNFLIEVGVRDAHGLEDSTYYYLTVLDVEAEKVLVLNELGCNPDVVQGHSQYCSVHVTDENGNDVVDAEVTFTYTAPASVANEFFGTCTTNFKGYCHVDPIVDKNPGYYTVQAVATKNDYLSSNSLSDTFKVWKERYEIRSLEIYSDDNFNTPEDTFFRSEDMYAEFYVYDTISDQYICDEELVEHVFLRVNNQDPLNFSIWEELQKVEMVEPNTIEQLLSIFGVDTACSYRYWLAQIPVSDDYLGDGRVFAFTFNFTDNSAGQDSKEVTILNNPINFNPPASFVVTKATPSSDGTLIVDFSTYVTDVETQPQDALYTVRVLSSEPTLSVDNLGAGRFSFTTPAGHTADTLVAITADDTDGSKSTKNILFTIDVVFTPLLPIADAGDDQSTTVKKLVSFSGAGSFDPDGGNIVSYSWDFGNGQTFTDSSPFAHVRYDQVGTYDVTLTVTDDEGDTATDTAIITVDKIKYITQCSDGKDNDGDGLVDLDDPGCDDPGDNNEWNFGSSGPEDGLKIESIAIIGAPGAYMATPGDIVEVTLVLENHADEKLEDLRIGVYVPEIGVKQYGSTFDLRSGQRKTQTMDVYLPHDAWQGDYYVQLTVHDGDLRRSTHRFLEVI